MKADLNKYSSLKRLSQSCFLILHSIEPVVFIKAGINFVLIPFASALASAVDDLKFFL